MVLQAVKITADSLHLHLTPTDQHYSNIYCWAQSIYRLLMGDFKSFFPVLALGSFSNYTCMKPSERSLEPK